MKIDTSLVEWKEQRSDYDRAVDVLGTYVDPKTGVMTRFGGRFGMFETKLDRESARLYLIEYMDDHQLAPGCDWYIDTEYQALKRMWERKDAKVAEDDD